MRPLCLLPNSDPTRPLPRPRPAVTAVRDALGSLAVGSMLAYVSAQVLAYSFLTSTVDLALLSLLRPALVGVAAWRLRHPRGIGIVLGMLMLGAPSMRRRVTR